jgi:hypothetical protein
MKPADALPEMRLNAENSPILGIQAQYALKCRHLHAAALKINGDTPIITVSIHYIGRNDLDGT